MKTSVLKYLKMTLLAAMIVNLSACEVEIGGFWDDDNIGGDYYNRSRDLCSRTWVRSYYDIDGNYCWQEVDYYLDRKGVDFIRIEYRNGGVYENEYRFKWNWENAAQTSIRMRYGSNDESYLDDVQIWSNRLTGYLDGWDNYVVYQGRY
ncbi:hypothetical protein H8744_13920 [Oscillospiraceae bacterium N12]|jgi:hypothetical protein|uniref:Lipoprotein n=1 Tax=Jilunia laotingensis TaxID=2763675 RepID=A0A926F5F2_9BACT|nr:hypothetical protein [Jilunia laotingensis]MBC8594320.1 hypothetical protein [Jilunia laotingensis]